MAQTAVTGCLCLSLPAPMPWVIHGGRLGGGRLAPRMPDLTLRVAELLARLQVPAALLSPVLGYATQSLIDTARLWHVEDEVSFVSQVRALSMAQMEDYVAALVGRRILVPDDDR